MKVFTTETSDIAAFKALTMNRDWNKGDIILDENGGLTCVNHHKWQKWNNGYTVSAQENADIRSVFSNALMAEYGDQLRNLKMVQGEKSQAAKILEKIDKMLFGKAGETSLSRATVKAVIEEIESEIRKGEAPKNVRQMQRIVAYRPLGQLLGDDFNDLFGLKEGEVPNPNLLNRVGGMVTEFLLTNAVNGKKVKDIVFNEEDRNYEARRNAMQNVITANGKFFATMLLKFLPGVPEFVEQLKANKNQDDIDPKDDFCDFVKRLDKKFCSGVWTSSCDNGDRDLRTGAYARAMLAVIMTVIGKQNGNYDLEVFDAGASEEICAYDVDRLKQFFTSCEEEKIDILRLEVKNENKVE